MKVSVTRPTNNPLISGVGELQLFPENDDDQFYLERLVDHYQIVGFGRDAATMKLNHVRVRLTGLEGE